MQLIAALRVVSSTVCTIVPASSALYMPATVPIIAGIIVAEWWMDPSCMILDFYYNRWLYIRIYLHNGACIETQVIERIQLSIDSLHKLDTIHQEQRQSTVGCQGYL